jgi:hypothetical protein
MPSKVGAPIVNDLCHEKTELNETWKSESAIIGDERKSIRKWSNRKMSETKTPITRREILVGGAAAVAVAGFPSWPLPTNPNLRALLRLRNKSEEKVA